jgi:hypothetical protein
MHPYPYAYPQHMKVVSHLISDIDVKAIMTSFLSINQLITLWFVDAEFPCFSVKFKKLG